MGIISVGSEDTAGRFGGFSLVPSVRGGWVKAWWGDPKGVAMGGRLGHRHRSGVESMI